MATNNTIVGIHAGAYSYVRSTGVITVTGLPEAIKLDNLLSIFDETTGNALLTPGLAANAGHTIAGSAGNQTITLSAAAKALTTANGDAFTILVAMTAANSPANPVTPAGVGIGGDFAVPAGSTNGTALTTAQAKPAGAIGVELIMDVGDSITCVIATSAPGAPPAKARSYSYATNGQRVFIDLAGTAMLYIISTVNGSSGSPLARWV